MKLFVGYSKAPEQPQSSARPICHFDTMTNMGSEPPTKRIAAYRSSPCYALGHGDCAIRSIVYKSFHLHGLDQLLQCSLSAWPAITVLHSIQKKGNRFSEVFHLLGFTRIDELYHINVIVLVWQIYYRLYILHIFMSPGVRYIIGLQQFNCCLRCWSLEHKKTYEVNYPLTFIFWLFFPDSIHGLFFFIFSFITYAVCLCSWSFSLFGKSYMLSYQPKGIAI